MAELRQAEEKDSAEVVEVLVKNFNIKTKEEAKNVFLEELQRYTFVVAVEDGKIVGIASWRTHGLPKHMLAECGRVAVLPEYDKKGIKTDLFEWVVQDADKFYKSHKAKVRKIYAYVHSSNKRMQKFYENLGLIQEAVLKDHYYKGEDEYVYSMFFD